MSLGSQVFLI